MQSARKTRELLENLVAAVGDVAFPEYAEQIRAVILCATLIYELVGPGVAKTCLKKAGEIKE